jgi:hypothetical protein
MSIDRIHKFFLRLSYDHLLKFEPSLSDTQQNAMKLYDTWCNDIQ